MPKSSASPTPSPHAHTFPSDLGWFTLVWNGERLMRISFGHPSASAAIANLESVDGWVATHSQTVPKWINQLAKRLQSYAAGNEETFHDVELDLSHLSAFQSRVVKACRRIGRGQVQSYGELAAAAGAKGAARAVGSVMSQNRFPIIVPCHRVVAAGGAIGGFSARDGVNMKRRMLEMEGAQVKGTRTRNHKAATRSRSETYKAARYP